MKLLPAQHTATAARAYWLFDVAFPQTLIPGDSCCYAGDGVDDLDRLLDLLAAFPTAHTMLDTGLFTSSWSAVDLEDVLAIRAAYVLKFGESKKPPWPDPAGSGIQV